MGRGQRHGPLGAEGCQRAEGIGQHQPHQEHPVQPVLLDDPRYR